MRIDVLTLFPEMLEGPLQATLLGRAQEAGVLDNAITAFRDFTPDRPHRADDADFGGGQVLAL